MRFFSALLFAFFSVSAFAFTLTTEVPSIPRYNVNEIAVDVSSNGCSAGFSLSAAELLDDVEEAVERYWNKVPTTRISFIRGEVLGTASTGLNLSDWANAAARANRIVVGCSNSGDHFSGTTLGIATIGSIGADAIGAVLLGDTARVGNLSRDERLAVLAHEIGHAFGLGHSFDETALMFFSTSASKIQTDLTRDDHDGITWLYPHDKDLGGCLGSLGTIAYVNSNKDDGKPPWGSLGTMSLGFILGILLLGFFRMIYGRFHLLRI